MAPAARAESRVGRGDVEAVRTDHQPVQAHEAQTFRCDDIAVFTTPGCRDCSRVLGKREGRDLDAFITGPADHTASVCERDFFECFVTDGVAEGVVHPKHSVYRVFARKRRLCLHPLCRSEQSLANGWSTDPSAPPQSKTGHAMGAAHRCAARSIPSYRTT